MYFYIKKNMDKSYNCIMIGYEPIEKIQRIQESIDENDLYHGDNNDENEYGLEKESHITLLYGLHENVTCEDVKPYLLPLMEYKAMLYNVSSFSNEKFDVLKSDIKSSAMKKTNKLLRDNLPHDDLHDEYHPHMTIAYLKPGTAKKYEQKMLDKIITITPKEYMFSYGKDGKYDKVKFNTLK